MFKSVKILIFIFLFNVTLTTEIYTLSLHDALPISRRSGTERHPSHPSSVSLPIGVTTRSEEHTSELQSRFDLVCRLLLEKKNSSTACTDVSIPHSRCLSTNSTDEQILLVFLSAKKV